MTPIADPHVCKLPPSADEREPREWQCRCGRRWHTEWFKMPDGRVLGPSWILESN